MAQKRGRKPTWTAEQRAAWQALRDSPCFKELYSIVSVGLGQVDKASISTLLSESPYFSSESSLSARNKIRAAIAKLPEPERQEALLAVLRATQESSGMSSVDSAFRLARVKLGEGEPHRERVARLVGRPADKVTDLELSDALVPKSNEKFRKTPGRSKPGTLWLLLRDLYEQLLPPDGEDLDLEGPHAHPDTSELRTPPSKADVDAVKAVVRQHYGTDLELTEFAKVLLTDHEVIEHLDMRVTLTDCDDDFYFYNVERHFQARFKHYTAAVAIGDATRAALMRCLPELKELIWLPPETPDLDEAVGELVQDGLLEIRDRSREGGYRSASFKRLPDDHDFEQRLRENESVQPESYRLLAVQITDEAELVDLRSTLHMRLNRSRRRCGWFADGPTYVDQVIIDLSGFADSATSDRANVYFFLPGTDGYSREPEASKKRFERNVHDWVVRHHGFAIHW